MPKKIETVEELEEWVHHFKNVNDASWESLQLNSRHLWMGRLGFFLDMVFPWISWYFGMVFWKESDHGYLRSVLVASWFHSDPQGWIDPRNGWNAALLIAGLVMSAVSARALCKTFNADNDPMDRIATLKTHVIVSGISSAVFLIDHLIQGVVKFVVITVFCRLSVSGVLYVYFRNLEEQTKKRMTVVESFFTLLDKFVEYHDENGNKNK